MATPMTPREAGEAAFYECEGNNEACLKAAFDAYEAAAKINATPDLLKAAHNAAATISAIYQWLEMVESAGGATSIRKNADRTESLVMVPLRAALSKAKVR